MYRSKGNEKYIYGLFSNRLSVVMIITRRLNEYLLLPSGRSVVMLVSLPRKCKSYV